LICEECGQPIEAGADTCGNCGCPVEPKVDHNADSVATGAVNEQQEGKKNKVWIIIVAIIAVLLVGMIVVIGNGDSGNTNDSASAETEAVTEPEYLLPNSSEEYITEEDLDGFSIEECTLAQYEIYARHGYIFPDAQYQEYLEAKSWYNPTVAAEEFSEDVFNQFEIANLGVIGNYQYTLTLAGAMEIGEAEYLTPADYEIYDGQKVYISGEFNEDRNGDMYLYGSEELIYLNGVSQETADAVFDSGISWVQVIGEFYVDADGFARINVDEFIVSEI